MQLKGKDMSEWIVLNANRRRLILHSNTELANTSFIDYNLNDSAMWQSEQVIVQTFLVCCHSKLLKEVTDADHKFNNEHSYLKCSLMLMIENDDNWYCA